MKIKELLKKVLAEKEEVEMPVEEEQQKQIMIKIENLKDFVDIERVARIVKEGSIVFLKTRELQKEDLGEFQNCVQKLKKLSVQFGWDIAGTEEGYIVVTPQFARIER